MLAALERYACHCNALASRRQYPALPVRPDLDAAADAEEVVMLLLVVVQRDRTTGGTDGGHHRHGAGRLLLARECPANLPEQKVSSAVSVRQ